MHMPVIGASNGDAVERIHALRYKGTSAA